jgi:hypothetical protein
MTSLHDAAYTALAAVRAAANKDRPELARLLNSLDAAELRKVALALALMLESLARQYYPRGVDEYIEFRERVALTDEAGGEDSA